MFHHSRVVIASLSLVEEKMYVQKKAWIIIIFSLNVAGAITWMTNITQDWSFQCPPNHPIKNIISDYYSNYHDRVWNISCSETDIGINFTHCEWSIYINDLRHLLIYQCPNEGMLTGMTSYFQGDYLDRRYQFLCCYPHSYAVHGCQHTGFLNEHTVLLSYRFPDNWYLRGVISTWHNFNNYKDRRWVLNICRLDQIVLQPEC